MKKKLNRRRFKAKNDKGQWIGTLDAISIVDKPAIEKSFQLFTEEEFVEKINFQISSEERMEISGIAMTPDQDILRKDNETGELYYCYFTEQDIRDYRDYFMKYGSTKKANLNHEDVYFKDFYITESWQVENPDNDKLNALGFKDIKKGDWAVTMKVTSMEMWEKVKNGDFNGFSVELSLSEFKEEKIKEIVFNEELSEEERLEMIRKIIYGN